MIWKCIKIALLLKKRENEMPHWYSTTNDIDCMIVLNMQTFITM